MGSATYPSGTTIGPTSTYSREAMLQLYYYYLSRAPSRNSPLMFLIKSIDYNYQVGLEYETSTIGTETGEQYATFKLGQRHPAAQTPTSQHQLVKQHPENLSLARGTCGECQQPPFSELRKYRSDELGMAIVLSDITSMLASSETWSIEETHINTVVQFGTHWMLFLDCICALPAFLSLYREHGTGNSLMLLISRT
ncbi:hypothetical protein BJ508DRAFT_308533 [Ascobolus immersus RN42]|uniref:Uncharacterized protein n=1 Tax=Ascobolus immersus RN42 TaxID=1160509 RepID=A0A3N4I3L3_ASCIM|nr:hypothetical protein BJ508DRAFT_308533 [Ascobolus immersus RN42]